MACDYRATYNFTGTYNATYNGFVAPLSDFNVTPDTFTGVA